MPNSNLDDQTRLGTQTELERKYLEQSITIEQFIDRIGDKSLNDLRHYKENEAPIVEIGPFKIERPRYTEESYRYVRDPRDPEKVIDMDHFLANADLNSNLADDIGFLVELRQLQLKYPSAFMESDIRSNFLGEKFGTDYYGSLENALERPLRDYLFRFFNDYKNDNLPGQNFPYFLPKFSSSVRDAFDSAEQFASPLVLDLDGDGIELTSLTDQVVRFDIDGDGIREATGWVKADDGLLVLDRNGDKFINDISELFGSQVQGDNGFLRLQQLDSNSDNQITAADTLFSQLQVWRDIDQDGNSDINELFSLAQLGISQISLSYTVTDQTIAGNKVLEVSSYKLANGTQRQIVDVWFALDQFNSQYDFRSTANQPITLTNEILALPTLSGYGNLPDLYIATAKDAQLLQLVQLFQQKAAQGDFYGARDLVRPILFRWAGVDGVTPGSRGQYVDAQELAFLEMFVGHSFNQVNVGANPNQVAGPFLTQTFADLYLSLQDRLMAQSFSGSVVSYDALSDQLVYDGTLEEAALQLWQNLAFRNSQWLKAISSTTEETFAIHLLEQYLQQEGFNLIEGGNSYDDLRGQSGNDIIYAWSNDDVINGQGGDDIIDSGWWSRVHHYPRRQ